MTMLLIAGIAVLAAGLLAVAFGIPVKEFSFGNTLILAGAVAACTGVIMLGLAVVVRELQNIARRLGPANPAAAARAKSEPQLPVPAADQPAPETLEGAEPASKQSLSAPSAAPWQEEVAARDRGRGDGAPEATPPEPAAATKPRRNLLFSSSSRKERERAAQPPDPAAADSAPPPLPPPSRRRRRKNLLPPPLKMPGRNRTGRGPTHCGAPARLRRSPSPMLRARAGAPCANRAERGAGSGDGAEIRRRRRDGLFAVFRWLDRGANAGGHDALRIHR